MSFLERVMEIAKSVGVTGKKDFAFYKKWALDHLKKQLNEEKTVEKALEYCEEYLEKAYGVGTIRTWKGKKYIKGPDKKWRRYYDKHSRGSNQAIAHIMREINALEDGDVEGLYKIIQKNAGRFRDQNGNVLPEVQQIHDLVEKKQSGTGSKKEEKKEKYDDNAAFEEYKKLVTKDETTSEENSHIAELVKEHFKHSNETWPGGAKLKQEMAKEEKKTVSERVQEVKDGKKDVEENKDKYSFAITIFKDQMRTWGKKELEDYINEKQDRLDNNKVPRVAIQNIKNQIVAAKELLKEKFGDEPGEKNNEPEETEQEKHDNRSNAMKGNQNAKKYGNIEVDEKNRKRITDVMNMDNEEIDRAIENFENEIKKFPNGSNVLDYKERVKIFKNEKEMRKNALNELEDNDPIPGVYDKDGLNTISKIADVLKISTGEARKRVRDRWSNSDWGNDPMKRYLDINDDNGKGYAGIPDFSKPLYDNAVKEVIEDHLIDKLNLKGSDNDTFRAVSEEAYDTVNGSQSLKQAEENIKKRIKKGDERKTKEGFVGTELETVVEKYASDKDIKNLEKKISESDFAVKDDPNKPFMSGVYNEDGYKIATDGRFLAMIKADYPKEDEGKIKGNAAQMKYIGKKIENLKSSLPAIEDKLKKAAEEKGTGSKWYEVVKQDLDDTKKEIADLEEQVKTGNVNAMFPNYKRVIPSLGNRETIPQEGFEDFNKVLKTAMVAAAYRKQTKSYLPAYVRVGDKVYDAERLSKVMAMAKKHELNEIVTYPGEGSAVEFKGDNGSIVIMPMTRADEDRDGEFNANTGEVKIEDKEKSEEFLSGGEKETRTTFMNNRSKYETKFDKDVMDIMNHFEKQKGLTPSKYHKNHNYIRVTRNPEHIGNEQNEDFKNAMNDLKDLYKDYQDFRTDIYNRRFEEGKENRDVSSKEIKTFFEDGIKKIKDKYGIKKSFTERITEIMNKSDPEQGEKKKHDLEFYKKWALSILENQKEEPEDDGPNEKTIVKALAYTEIMMKSVYPIGTIREWKGKKYIKVAPNKWKPKYDNMNRSAKMSLEHLKNAVSKCNSEEELFKLMNSNASRFRDPKTGYPFPEVQELHDFVTKRSNEISNGGSKENETINQPTENKNEPETENEPVNETENEVENEKEPVNEPEVKENQEEKNEPENKEKPEDKKKKKEKDPHRWSKRIAALNEFQRKLDSKIDMAGSGNVNGVIDSTTSETNNKTVENVRKREDKIIQKKKDKELNNR